MRDYKLASHVAYYQFKQFCLVFHFEYVCVCVCIIWTYDVHLMMIVCYYQVKTSMGLIGYELNSLKPI